MMKRVWIVMSLAASLAIATTARADNYSEAFAAAEIGNYHQAFVLFSPLAEQGNAQAQFNLALMYHGGLGVKRNEEEAVHWYRQAAANGSKEAQEFLAVGYQEGWFGLPHDEKQSHYWLNRLNNS